MKFTITQREYPDIPACCAHCGRWMHVGDECWLERGQYSCSEDCSVNHQLVEFARAERINARKSARWDHASDQDSEGRLK